MTSIPTSPRNPSPPPEVEGQEESMKDFTPGFVQFHDITFVDSSVDRFTLHEFKGCTDIDGGILIIATPTTHSVTSLVTCGYLTEQMELPLIASATSPLFPPRVILENSVASHSVRIMGKKLSGNCSAEVNNSATALPTTSDEDAPEDCDPPVIKSIAVLQCDLKMSNTALHNLSTVIINFIHRHEISEVFCLEGLPTDPEKLRKAVKKKGGLKIRYTTSSKSIYDLIQRASKNKPSPVPNGVIGGFTGLMMSSSPISKFNCTILYAPTTKDYPDAHSAVAIVKFFNKYLHLGVDTSLLENKAHKLELAIKKVISRQSSRSVPDYYS